MPVKSKRGGKSRGRTSQVDFGGVDSSGRSCDDGTYPAELKEIEEEESKSSGEPMWTLKWAVTIGKNKTVNVYDHCSLQHHALWKAKQFLEAIGEDVPDGVMDIDLNHLEGSECRVTIVNEEYEGKDRPKITEYSSLEDKGDDDEEENSEDEDERPTSKDRRGKKSSKEEEDNSDDGEDEEDDEKPSRGRPKKVRVGAVVKFKDSKGKTIKGTITKIDGDEVVVEDDSDDEWELSVEDLTVV